MPKNNRSVTRSRALVFACVSVVLVILIWGTAFLWRADRREPAGDSGIVDSAHATGQLERERYSGLLDTQLEQQLILVQRVCVRSGEIAPGLSQADFDTCSTARNFATRALQSLGEQASTVRRGRALMVLAFSSAALREWRLAGEAAQQAAGVFDSVEAAEKFRVDFCEAQNLVACAAVRQGFPDIARSACQAVELATDRIADGSADRPFLLWQRTLAFRNRALLEAYFDRDGREAGRASLEVARELYASGDEDLGFYKWDLPHFLLDALQICVILEASNEAGDVAQAYANAGLQACDKIEADLREVTARHQQGMPISRLAQMRDFFSWAAKNASVNVQDLLARQVVERHFARCMHPEWLMRTRLPGEFEPQEEICVSWIDEEWAQPVLANMIAELAANSRVRVFVPEFPMQGQIELVLQQRGIPRTNIRFSALRTDTVWTRDYGPLGVLARDGRRFLVDFPQGPRGRDFRLRDEYVGAGLTMAGCGELISGPLVLEGGHLMTNGAGICLVSTEVFKKNQSLGMQPQQIRRTLQRLTGASTIIPVEPLLGEPTGHLDLFATFTAADSLILGKYPVGSDANAAGLDQLAQQLRGIKTTGGELKVTRIPMPPRPESGEWRGQSYTNVVYANGKLLMPSYGEWENSLEQEAIAVFRRLLPNYTIVTIATDALASRGGALHCATYNLPQPRADSGT